MRKFDHWHFRKMLVCAVLCPALAACSGGVKSTPEGKPTPEVKSTSGVESQAEAGKSTSGVNFTQGAGNSTSGVNFTFTPEQKEETVYVKADASGAPLEKNVEVVLRGIEGGAPIEDRSDLRDIKNTEGDEEFAEDGSGRYLWENHGEEIHYKGVSDKALPVDVSVTYYLEGQEVTPAQIAGKTGAVRIRFDYENHTDVPFMVLSSVLLDSAVFSDVKVTNGRVIDLGEQRAVLGFAFPGLLDSLRLADYEPTEEIELPEYVEIEARADKFALDFTASVVSTGLFEEVKDEDLRDLEEMPEDMNELTDASKELKDAAGELADGGEEFGGYLAQYFDGLSQISEGSDALDQGLAALSGNIGKLSGGAGKVESGLRQLDKALAGIDLSQLSSKESKEAAEAASKALETIGKDSAALFALVGSVSENLASVQIFADEASAYKEKVDALLLAVDSCGEISLKGHKEEIEAQLQEELGAQLQEQASGAAREAALRKAEEIAGETAEDARASAADAVRESGALDEAGLTDEQIEAIKEQLIAEVTESIDAKTVDPDSFDVETEEIDPDLDGAADALVAAAEESCRESVSGVILAAQEVPEFEVPVMQILSEEQMEAADRMLAEMEQSLGVLSAYAEGMSSLQASLSGVRSSMTQLRSGVSALSKGSTELTRGIGAFSEALKKTSEGSAQLNKALSEASGAGNTLGSAYRQLVDGMNAFADGVSEFDEEGIQSLAELTGPEYLAVIRGVREARDAEQGYNNFSGICDGQKGSVKFIIETAEIGADN